MRVKWWNFWIKANALEFSLHHFVLISTIFYHLTLIQSLKWVLNDCQSFHTQILPFQSFPFHSMAEWSSKWIMTGLSQGCHWRMVVKWPDWCWDVGHSWWRRFWSPTSLAHPCHFESSQNVSFVIPWSFKHWMTPEWMRWCWNDHFLTL